LLLVYPSWNHPLRAITINAILSYRHDTTYDFRTSSNYNHTRTQQPVQRLRLSALELR
jgi:hypothetical protein